MIITVIMRELILINSNKNTQSVTPLCGHTDCTL